MKTIPLTQGRVAVVDNADYALVSRYRWYAHKRRGKHHTAFYAATRPTAHILGCGMTVLMHRLIMNALPGQQVDHRNGDGLRNTRRNLRLCNKSENCRNMRVVYATSGLKGVSARTTRAGTIRWIVRVGGRYKGMFDTKFQAAAAYDSNAITLFGQFAATNRSLGLI